MTERRLTDMSRTPGPGLPTWPGDTAPAAAPTWARGPACPVRVSATSASALAPGVRLIGIDWPSDGGQEAARAADMRIPEELVFDDVAQGDALIALPIRPGGLDTAPVHAVLRALS